MTLRARRLKPSHVPAVPRFSSACRAKYVRCRIECQLAELNDFMSPTAVFKSNFNS